MKKSLTYRSRLLPPAEWDRVAEFEYFATGGLPPQDGHSHIFVSEVAEGPTEGEIAWAWMAKDVVLLEGLAVAPAHQNSLRAGLGLIAFIREFLCAAGVRYPLTITTEDSLAQMPAKLGFEPIYGGVLHVWHLDEHGRPSRSGGKKRA